VVTNDDRTLAPRFGGDDAVGELRGHLADALADLVAAREQDDVDTGILHQRLADLGITVDEVDYPGGKARFEEQFDQALADGGGIFGRLEDAGVALQQAGPEHPQRHGEGEVPGRDDGTDAPRFAANESVFLGDLRGDDVAGRHAAGAEDVLHHV